MKPLLLEIGVEELPASFVASALEALPRLAEEALRLARLEHGAIRALGTPRRLALVVEGLADAQADLAETVMGPPKAAAFEEDGTPKKGAIGFAKKLGVEVSDLTIEETDKGPYVAGRREEKGRAASEVLPELLSAIIPRIPFPKSMRWGLGDIAFGRPVHWMVCLHGEAPVDVSFAGVSAGRESRGHRFLSPESFSLASADAYVGRLREAHVVVDPEERSSLMVERLRAAATSAGGVLVEDAFLVGENMTLVEEPHVICGTFDPVFLELPDAVTIDVMRDHQRYFALRDAQGALMPRYLAVVNTDRAPEVIAKGNDRVLRARLADARFFVAEDRKTGLSAMVGALENVVFQNKLGSVADRAKRLATQLDALAFDGDRAHARAAAELCKADLVSLIVGEFPDLQGAMGRWYAELEGQPVEVATAIEEHYRPAGAKDELPTGPVSAALAVVDRLDLLVGCFGLGQIPTGSADPYALRRATLGVIRIALEGPIDVPLREALGVAWDAYAAQGVELKDRAAVLASLDEFFRGRLRASLTEGRQNDIVDACLGAWDGGSLRDLAARLDALEGFRQEEAYEALAIAFKRAFNITKDAPEGEPDPTLMVEDAEKALAERWSAVRARVAADVEAREYAGALRTVATELRAPIDRFFDDVLVMDPDPAIRDNRLRLLASIARVLTAIAHFHELA